MFIREVHLYRDTISMIVARINLSRNISPTTTKFGLVLFKDKKLNFFFLLLFGMKAVGSLDEESFHYFVKTLSQIKSFQKALLPYAFSMSENYYLRQLRIVRFRRTSSILFKQKSQFQKLNYVK